MFNEFCSHPVSFFILSLLFVPAEPSPGISKLITFLSRISSRSLQRGFIEGWHHYCNVIENLHKLAFKLHHQTAMVCKKKNQHHQDHFNSLEEITMNMGDYKQDHSSTYSHYWSPCKLLASDPTAAPEISTNRKLTLSWPYIYFSQDTWIISRPCNQSH